MTKRTKVLQKFYNFLNKSPVNRTIVGGAISLILLSGLYVGGTAAYNTLQDTLERNRVAAEKQQIEKASPKDWVDFYQVNVANARIGLEPQMTVCRKLKQGTVNITAVRTFYRYADGQVITYAEYNFKASIEDATKTNTECITVPLKNQPQIPGDYSIRTEYCFKVKYGIEKCDFYESNKYRMSNDIPAIQEQIKELQEQLNMAQAIDSGGGTSQSFTQPNTNSSQSSQSQPQQVTLTPTQSQETARSDEQIKEDTKPARTGLVGGLLDFLGL